MLKNKSGKKVISQQVELANTPWKRFKGLMLRSTFKNALIFNFPQKTRISASVHNFFVFFPIDLVYLDDSKKIVDLRTDFKPFTLNYTPKTTVKYLIELPAGTIRRKDLRENDLLTW